MRILADATVIVKNEAVVFFTFFHKLSLTGW